MPPLAIMAHKKIAVITMVRNDAFFLRKWVSYYGAQFGRENLYVFFDGLDQKVPDFCEGVNTQVVEKIGDTVVSSDRGRINFISSQASKLFEGGYELVIGGDADEYLVVDPKTGKSLPEFLSETDVRCCLSGLGLDFGQKLQEEGALTEEKPFLQQRHYAQIGTRYTKASVIAKPCEWGAGFHRVRRHNFHIAPDLYLLHFGYSDNNMIAGRMSDSDRRAQGWRHHIKKRARTTRLVSTLKARDFDVWTRFARICESLVRKPYAWNKPGFLGMRIVVKIPSRFRDVL